MPYTRAHFFDNLLHAGGKMRFRRQCWRDCRGDFLQINAADFLRIFYVKPIK